MILVTGSSGFIGKHLVNSLLNSGRPVRQVSRNKKDEGSFHINQLDGKTNWSGAFEQVESVVHLAGLAHSNTHSEEEFDAVNHEATLRLAQSAAEAGVKKFVFISTIGVYGTNPERPIDSNSSVNPDSFYSQSKFKAERALQNLAESSDMKLVIIRPVMVYGKEAKGSFHLLSKIVEKLPFLPFGLCNNRRSFIAVENLVDLIAYCTRTEQVDGKVILAADSEPLSTKQLTTAIAKGLNKKLINLPVPVVCMTLPLKMIRKGKLAQQLFGNYEVKVETSEHGWKPPYTVNEALTNQTK